jgi:AraC-like DNA-binding protein
MSTPIETSSLMKFEQYTPNVHLAPYVKEYLILESEAGITNLLLPDMSVVIAIRYKGQVTTNDNGQVFTLLQAVITGIRSRARSVCYDASSANVLIIFNPGMTRAFFDTPAHEFAGASIPLDDLEEFPDGIEVSEVLNHARTNKERILIVEQILMKKLMQRAIDPLIIHAARQISSNAGNIRIRDLVQTLSISRDAFEKRFRQSIGTSPKRFSSIVRMRKLVKAGKDEKSLTELAYDFGYFDQSHFIKDFKLFTGKTPSSFFKSARFW